MKVLHNIVKGPCLTEKATDLAELGKIVVLKVDTRANKIEIKHAVERLFNVKVATVNTTRMHGKQKRVGVKSLGHSKDWKKAYITLSEGEINFLDEL